MATTSNASASGSDLPFASKLFDAADGLRGRVESAEYKHLVLGLLFLRYISDTFERHQEALQAATADPAHELFTTDEDERADILDDRDEYLAANVFWVPGEARYSHLLKGAGQAGNGPRVDRALELIELENVDELRGVLPRHYARSELPNDAMGELITLIANVDLGASEEEARDRLGRTYEYFIKSFAKAEGHRGGEFFTPQSVVNLLVEMVQPFEGRVFDPASGSCGMFIQSARFAKAHGGRARDISLFGQESAMTNWRIGRMNLALHGLTGDIRGGESSLTNDQHPGLKADYVLANPPFNQKNWGADQVPGDPRWRFGEPPARNANYAWIQHFIAHLTPNGRAAFVMGNGAVSSSRWGQDQIRAAIVEEEIVDCVITCPGQLFFTTGVPVSLWILDRGKKTTGGARRREVLFIDARGLGVPISRAQIEFSSDDIARIAGTYEMWRASEAGDYEDQPGFCASASLDEIAAQRYSLAPTRYVAPSPVDLVERTKLTEELAALQQLLAGYATAAEQLDHEIAGNLTGFLASLREDES